MWLLYAGLTIFFYVGLDFFVKKASGRIDDFLGGAILSFFALLPSLLVYLYLKLNSKPILYSNEGAIFSIIAGISIGLGTITFLKMFSTGTNLSLGSPIVRMGTIIGATIVGVLVLNENLSMRQIVGLILSIIGITFVLLK